MTTALPSRSRLDKAALWAVTALYGALAAAMFLWLSPRVGRACGVGPLDARPGWTSADAAALAASCDLAAYRDMATLDLVFPLVGAVAITWWTVRLLAPLPWRRWAAIPALAMGLADYAENITIWQFLRAGGPVDGAYFAAGGTFTTLKFVLGAIAFATLAVAVVIAIIRRRRSPSRS